MGASCWIVVDDKVGVTNQCIGLAEALGFDFVVKRVSTRALWRYLPLQLWFAPFHSLGPGSDPLEPPWPDVLITGGRRPGGLSMAIKRASGGKTFTIQLQDPYVDLSKFDLAITPRHDHCKGDNVVEMLGALHHITPQRLAEHAARLAPTVAHLPRPLVAVMIGGTNRCYTLTAETGHDIGERLAAMARASGAGLMVSTSRRSGPELSAAIKERLRDVPAVMWEGQGENPYFAYLGLAEYIVVTCDSVSMVTEACATGKPVYVIELEGGSRKFLEFHDSFRRAGYTRPFTGVLERWQPPPLTDMQQAVAEIKRRLAKAGIAVD
jgi:mitochondrial fission protein ELM1